MKSIAVFCGSSSGTNPSHAQAAEQLGKWLAENQLELVYGAGNVGLMGILADAALAAGGRVLGVIPDFLMRWEVAHHGLSELIVTETMHQRKQMMSDRADAFVVLPGGFGTLDEFFEILTWRQLQLHNKPIGILNVHGYFDALLQLRDHQIETGFIRSEHRRLFVVADRIERLFEMMSAPSPEPLEKWWDEGLDKS